MAQAEKRLMKKSRSRNRDLRCPGKLAHGTILPFLVAIKYIVIYGNEE